MGTCITSSTTTGSIYLQSQDRVLHLPPKGWSDYNPLIIHQVRSSHQKLILTEDELIQDPPEDSLTTKVESIIPNTVKSTRTHPLGRAQIPIPTTPLWIPTLTSNRSSEDHIASAIREVTVIAVIDESYKANWVTSVLIIEGSKYAKHQIAATCTSPGHSKYQDAYRSELAFIFHVVSIVEYIILKLNISGGSITITCDRLNAI